MSAAQSLALVAFSLVALGYLAVAAVCCIETLIENRHRRGAADRWLAAGMLLSLFWPVLLAVALADALRRRVQSPGDGAAPQTDQPPPRPAGDRAGRIDYDPA